ncbi:Uncharacterised protein [Burkholderia pseudomallei]|nr:Uncharacterised protein [Burkholderia pseudomallei]
MSSPASCNDSVSSNCAVCSGVSTARIVSPGIVSSPSGMFCQTNITWNSGGCAVLRGGFTRSTT